MKDEKYIYIIGAGLLIYGLVDRYNNVQPRVPITDTYYPDNTDIVPAPAPKPKPSTKPVVNDPAFPVPDEYISEWTLTAAKADSAAEQIFDAIHSFFPEVENIYAVFDHYIFEPEALDVLYAFYGTSTVMNSRTFYFRGTLYDTLREILRDDEKQVLNQIIYNNTAQRNYI